jgi:hypothetical protein
MVLLIFAKSTNHDTPYHVLNLLFLRSKYFPEHCSGAPSMYVPSFFSERDKVSHLQKTTGSITFVISGFQMANGKQKILHLCKLCCVIVMTYYMAEMVKHCICLLLILLVAELKYDCQPCRTGRFKIPIPR